MNTVSLKLPDPLLELLEKEAKARGTTIPALVREYIERQLPEDAAPANWAKPAPGESLYHKALPILKKAWARNAKLPRDLAANPEHMKGFGE